MKKIKIFYSSDQGQFHSAIDMIVDSAIKQSKEEKGIDIELLSPWEMLTDKPKEEAIFDYLKKSDIVITDIGTDRFSVMYEIGIAQALKKPNILIVNSNITLPFDIINFKYLTYNEKSRLDSLRSTLKDMIIEAVENPNLWIQQSGSQPLQKEKKTVFVSYSHKDISYLERIKVHFKALERKSWLQLWSDTVMAGGEKWKNEIEKALNRSSVAILLISADFLASDFIINNELQPLLKQAEEKGTTILPVIIKPCRFLREPNISQFQAVNDPANPLCKLSEFEQEEIYEKISQRVETILQSI